MARANTKAWKRIPLEERKAIEAHEKRLRELPCAASRTFYQITLHHCHGGSLKDIGYHVGGGQKASDWLQIPLTSDLHVGDGGIDGAGGIGVPTWEAEHGAQVDMLKWICRELGVNVFEKAGISGIDIYN